MQLQFAVGREKSGAAAGGTAADDVLVDQHHLEALLQEFGGRADPAETAADDQDVALD